MEGWKKKSRRATNSKFLRKKAESGKWRVERGLSRFVVIEFANGRFLRFVFFTFTSFRKVGKWYLACGAWVGVWGLVDLCGIIGFRKVWKSLERKSTSLEAHGASIRVGRLVGGTPTTHAQSASPPTRASRFPSQATTCGYHTPPLGGAVVGLEG